MKLFGYSNDDIGDYPKILSEVSIECTVGEIDSIVAFLSKVRNEIVSWSERCDHKDIINSDDFAEFQYEASETNANLYVLVSLNDAVKKYSKKT